MHPTTTVKYRDLCSSLCALIKRGNEGEIFSLQANNPFFFLPVSNMAKRDPVQISLANMRKGKKNMNIWCAQYCVHFFFSFLGTCGLLLLAGKMSIRIGAQGIVPRNRSRKRRETCRVFSTSEGTQPSPYEKVFSPVRYGIYSTSMRISTADPVIIPGNVEIGALTQVRLKHKGQEKSHVSMVCMHERRKNEPQWWCARCQFWLPKWVRETSLKPSKAHGFYFSCIRSETSWWVLYKTNKHASWAHHIFPWLYVDPLTSWNA